jgi:hypothetical protein
VAQPPGLGGRGGNCPDSGLSWIGVVSARVGNGMISCLANRIERFRPAGMVQLRCKRKGRQSLSYPILPDMGVSMSSGDLVGLRLSNYSNFLYCKDLQASPRVIPKLRSV